MVLLSLAPKDRSPAVPHLPTLQVLALHEGDLPYALQIACSGLVETIGRATLE